MNGHRPHILIYTARQSNWLERVLYVLGGAAVLVVGFFFFTVALVVGALLALVIIARGWWLSRKLQRARNRGVYEGEYEVVEHAEFEERRSRPGN